MFKCRGVLRRSSINPRRVLTSTRRFSDVTKPGHGKTVAVAMSGGIDSAVAALLLQDQGYNCVGVFMKNWDPADECGSATCDISADVIDMRQVCKRLNIPAYEVDFVKEYWNEVFTPFLDAYQTGVETPNPDAFCNRFVKFSHFRKFVTQKLGIDTIATGHYARMVDSSLTGSKNGVVSGSSSTGGTVGTGVQMLRGLDPLKDQSYFLALTKGSALQNVLFPIGHLPKAEVKAIASARLPGLNILTKHESMGICFIGKRDMKDFLQDYITLTKGRFIDLDTGKVVGHHDNFEYFTIGQKARLPNFNAKYYVVGRKRNVLVNGESGRRVESGSSSGANVDANIPATTDTSIDNTSSTNTTHTAPTTTTTTATSTNTSGDVYVVKDLFHPALFTPYIIQPLRGINWFAGHPPEVLMATLRDEGVARSSGGSGSCGDSGDATGFTEAGSDGLTAHSAGNNTNNTNNSAHTTTNTNTTNTNTNTTNTTNNTSASHTTLTHAASSKKKLFRCEVKCRYSQLPTGCTMELVLNPELLAFHNNQYNVIHSDLSSDSGSVGYGTGASGGSNSSNNIDNNNTLNTNYAGTDMNNVMIKIVFDVPQRAITPGQILAIYENEVVLGGAVIAVQPLHLANGELLML